MIKSLTITLIAVVASAFTLIAAPYADAQNYPPPTPTFRPGPPSPRPGPPSPRPTGRPSDASCLVVSGQTPDGVRANRAQYQGELFLQGRAGCAAPHGDVSFTVESDPVVLGSTQAFEDGSYRATFTLPAAVQPGDHTVIADVEGRGEVRQPLVVIDASTRVGGVSQANEGSGGLLPRTGAGIAVLVLWAVAMLGLGTALVLAARRRFALAGAPGRARTVLALPAPEVPRIDTSRFVPYRSRTPGVDVRSERGTLTEWDVYGKERHKS